MCCEVKRPVDTLEPHMFEFSNKEQKSEGKGMRVCLESKQFMKHADEQGLPHASPYSLEPEQNVERWPIGANSSNNNHEKSAMESRSFRFSVQVFTSKQFQE